MKERLLFSTGDRVELTTARGSNRAATVEKFADLCATVVMDEGGPRRVLSCLAWELARLDPSIDRGPPAMLQSRLLPPAPRGRLRRTTKGRRRR
jgi:hypothetical protein